MTENMTVAQFVDVLKAHLNVVAIGLSAANPHVPGHVFAPALAAAVGKVLSEATAMTDISSTITLRGTCLKAFTECLKGHVPPIQAAEASLGRKSNGADMAVNANGQKH